MRQSILLLFTFFSIVLFAENNNEKTFEKCGTVAPSIEWENSFQKQIQKFKEENPNARTSNNIVIPVIVHIVYYTNNSSQNLSKAKVDSQIAILNRDFAGMSEFVNNTPTPFKPLIANTGITFCPAKMKPDGTLLTEPGIERINGRAKGYGDPFAPLGQGYSGWRPNGKMEEIIKPETIWDPKFYFNIWVVPNIENGPDGSILGYATFPTMSGLDGIGDGSGYETNDGIVILASQFGKIVSDGVYGGTATHETGHWLGLRHIWGDANCGNDYCDDTPTHKKANYNCPTFPKIDSCNFNLNGDMFMNYMDYVDDQCYTMFTNGQKERMLTTMQNGNLRVPLITSPVCDTIKPAPIAKFTYKQITPSNCVNSVSINFTDKSMFAPTSWQWTFEGGIPATSNVKNPTGIVFNTPGLKNVTLVVTSPKGQSQITSQINVVMTGNNTPPLYEDFENETFPPAGWSFVKRSSDPAHNWERREEISGYGIGNGSMIYNNTEYDAGYKFDDILTPKLDFTGITANAKLKFDVAYTPYFADNDFVGDTLEVYISDNCGTSLTMLYSKGDSILATKWPGQGGEFYPTANQWRSDTVDIPSNFLNKSGIQMLFRNRGNYGHTIYVDNVSVFYPLPNPVPNFTLSKNAICVGESITLTNTTSGTADSVRWRINGGSPNTSSSNTTVNPTFNSNGNYNITLFVYTDTFKDSITKSITVTTKPTIVINDGGSILSCPGESVSLNASGGGVTSFNWNTGATGNTINVAPTVNTTYKVVGVLNGCASDSASYIINMKTKPTVSVNNTNIQICPGQSATFIASGATTYGWSNAQSGNSITVSPSVNTNYKVAGTTDGCKSDSVQVSVTIKPKPIISVSPQNSTICAGQSVTLSASNATTFGWSNGQTGTSISVSPVENTTYKVAGTTNGCTSDSVSASVNITTTNPTVTITKNPNVSTICEGDSITLTASGANNYTWTTNQNTASIKVAPIAQTSYGVVGSLTGCPTLRDSVGTTINVNAKPSTGSISRGGWDTIYVNPANGSSYLWYLNSNISPVATTSVPYYFATVNGNYSVQIVGANGCKSNKSASYNLTLTGIRNNAQNIGLKIYPNPNYGLFTIELSAQKYTNYELNIYNVAGRTIYQENFDVHSGLNSKKIQLQNIDKGIYFLSLKNEDGVATYQLLIQ